MPITARSGAPATPPPRVFLGRDRELTRLTSALAAGDTGGFVAVIGEGGIGKTALIDEALARSGRTHLRASADVMDRRRSHGLLLDAFAPLLSDADRRLASARNEHAVAERMLALIDEVCTEPAVLVLEDLHWADAASLGLLSRLGRALEQLPLIIVGALRSQAPHETPPALDRLLGGLSERDLLRTIELGPLPAQSCVAIAERLTGARVDGALARYLAESGGNPLFLTEMIRALLRDGAVTIDEHGQALLDAPVGPSPSLAMVMMRHLSHLGPATRELLATAALLGTRFPLAHLRVAADRSAGELLPLLRESFAAGFLEEADDGTVGFRHELIQEVLLHDLPAVVRAELHRETAARLDAAGVPAATVAGHLLHAPTAHEDLDWMLALAQRTAMTAPATAVELWERIAQATDADDERHARAVAGLARSALSAGRSADACALAESVLGEGLRGEGVPADVLPAVTATYTHALMMQHRHDESQEQSERFAVAEVLEPAARAAHLAFAGWPRMMLGDLDGAKRLASEGAAMAEQVGNHEARVLALALHGQILDFEGDIGGAIALLGEAATVADRHPSLGTIEAFPHAMLALAMADADRIAEVPALLHRAGELAEEFGYRTGLVAAHAFGAQARSRTSILSDISAELDAHRSLVGGMDVRMNPPIHGLRACVVALERGPAAAVEWAQSLDPVPDRRTWAGRGRSWIWLGLSQRERARGDALATVEVLWRGWSEGRDTGMLMECAELSVTLVQLAAKIAEERPSQRPLAVDRARRVAELVAALASRNPAVTHLQATALGVRGIVDGDAGMLGDAAELMAGSPRLFERARLSELAALSLPARERRGRMLAEAALQGYAELGADHEVARARAALRAAGRHVAAAPRIRPTFGWDALTRTEGRIAAQVATGATNPEIAQALSVSRRTVETHVSNVLTKLGLRSRTELAVLVARRVEDAGEHGQQIDPAAERRR